MSKKRRKFSSGFKAKVVLEALKERQTLQDLASKYDLHSSQIVNWKKEFLANADEVPDIDKLILDTGKSVSWMGDKIGLMRFYNNGSAKTWRYRLIQQLGLQLENQMKQINGII